MASLLKPINLKRKRNNINKGFLIVILIGTLILVDGYRIKLKKQSMSFVDVDTSAAANISYGETPINIKINSLGIDLEVREAKMRDGWWELSDKFALHQPNTAFPGQRGNTIIYAHNDSDLFGPLIKKSKNGQEIEITLKQGTVLKYKIAEIKEVNRTNGSDIKNSTNEVLTLYTCTGIFDSKRLIVKAYPVNRYLSNY